MVSLYEAKSKETSQAEQMIKKELADLKEKIESLLLIKKRDNFSTNQSIEKVKKKIQNLENTLEKLRDEKRSMEEKISNIKQMADDNYQKKVAIFKKTIKPLEDSKKLAVEEKEIMQDKIDSTEHKIVKTQKEISSIQKQLEDQRGIRDDLVQIKIQLHKKMDEYKNNYPDELQLFYEEEKNKQEIEELKSKAKALKEELGDSNFQREVVREEIVKIKDKINEHQEDYDITVDNLKTVSKVGESEIVKMESYINKKALEYDAPTLTTLIDQVCLDRFCYSTANKVLENQLKIIREISEEQAIEYNEKIDSIKQEISELKEGINVLKPRMKQIMANLSAEKSHDEKQRDNLVVSKFKAKAGTLKQLLETLRSKKLEFKERQHSLDNWMLKVKAYLVREDEDKIGNEELCISELDNSILESFLKNTLYKIEDFGSKKKLEEMLGFYVDKVARREKAIQQ